MTDRPGLLGSLAEAGVRFIIVGGMAGVAHGSARVTCDIDCVYARDADNIARLAFVGTVLEGTVLEHSARQSLSPGTLRMPASRRHNAGSQGALASSTTIVPALGNHENYGRPGALGG